MFCCKWWEDKICNINALERAAPFSKLPDRFFESWQLYISIQSIKKDWMPIHSLVNLDLLVPCLSHIFTIRKLSNKTFTQVIV